MGSIKRRWHTKKKGVHNFGLIFSTENSVHAFWSDSVITNLLDLYVLNGQTNLVNKARSFDSCLSSVVDHSIAS